MAEIDRKSVLDSMFYEADAAFIGSSSSGKDKTGNSTDQQPSMAILSTGEENRYAHYVKLYTIPKDNAEMTDRFLSKSMVLSKDRLLNTDGKRTFDVLSDRI